MEGLAFAWGILIRSLSHSFPNHSLACKIDIAAGLAGFKGTTITWGITLAICVGVAVLIHIMIKMPMKTTARAVLERTICSTSLRTLTKCIVAKPMSAEPCEPTLPDWQTVYRQ
jgi:hypothetical protein